MYIFSLTKYKVTDKLKQFFVIRSLSSCRQQFWTQLRTQKPHLAFLYEKEFISGMLAAHPYLQHTVEPQPPARRENRVVTEILKIDTVLIYVKFSEVA